jgi:hypothetical protein
LPRFRLLPLLLAVAALLLYAGACAVKRQHLDAAAPADISTTQPTAAAPQRAGNRLVTELPDLAVLPAGATFDLLVRAELADPVFQGSARVLFDADFVEPVAAQRGSLLLPESVVLLSAQSSQRLALSAVDRPQGMDACIPFAFTGRPGAAPLALGSGELFRITFRLKTAAPATVPVRLQNDPQYLQLRGPTGQRLAFELEREAGAQ